MDPGPNRATGESTRFYAPETLIVPPVFIGIFGLIAGSAIPDPGGRLIGIGAAALAVILSVAFLRTPYVAIVSPDGSLTFKALTRTIETSVARISRITFSSGNRGASSYGFEFDGSKARLGNRAGRALACDVVHQYPSVDAPARIRRIVQRDPGNVPGQSPMESTRQPATFTKSKRPFFVTPLAIILGVVAVVAIVFVEHALPRGPNVKLTTTQCAITAGGGQGFWAGTLVPLGPISQNSEVFVAWQEGGVALGYGTADVTAPIAKNQATPLAVHVYAPTPMRGSGPVSCSPVFKYDDFPAPPTGR
jgi:hypothetical protein